MAPPSGNKVRRSPDRGCDHTPDFHSRVHLLVFAAGGRKGIFQTFKTLTCGLTPSYLLHWIPFIGIVFDLWSVVLMILGIRELQKISSHRAQVVMIIAVLVPLIIAMYFYVAMASQAGPSAPLNMF